jgi:hypothetical protein
MFGQTQFELHDDFDELWSHLLGNLIQHTGWLSCLFTRFIIVLSTSFNPQNIQTGSEVVEQLRDLFIAIKNWKTRFGMVFALAHTHTHTHIYFHEIYFHFIFGIFHAPTYFFVLFLVWRTKAAISMMRFVWDRKLATACFVNCIVLLETVAHKPTS